MRLLVGFEVGLELGFVVSPGKVGNDVVGYFEGELDGLLVGQLVVGDVVGELLG